MLFRMNADARLKSSLERRRIESATQFLVRVWSAQPIGCVCLAARHAETRQWKEFSVDPEGVDVLLAAFFDTFSASEWDLYYCPSTFKRTRRMQQHANRSRFAWVDIDNGNPNDFDPPPTILIETSPGRFQGLWRLEEFVSREDAEAISKALAYQFGGDRNGWSSTKLLRIPYTVNHKPAYDHPVVRLVRQENRCVSAAAIQRLLKGSQPGLKRSGHFEDRELDPAAHDWRSVVEKYGKLMPGVRRSLMKDDRCHSRDRSSCIFMIVQSLHAAGAEPDEIAAVVWRSPYFISKYGANRETLNREINRILSKLEGAK